jgi:hypothetical protein
MSDQNFKRAGGESRREALREKTGESGAQHHFLNSKNYTFGEILKNELNEKITGNRFVCRYVSGGLSACRSNEHRRQQPVERG